MSETRVLRGRTRRALAALVPGAALVAVGIVAVADDWAFWGERVTLGSGVENHLNGAVVVVGSVAGDDARAEVSVTRVDGTVTDVLGPGSGCAWPGGARSPCARSSTSGRPGTSGACSTSW
ncbi:hypothetical protein [Cellulomonas soli]